MPAPFAPLLAIALPESLRSEHVLWVLALPVLAAIVVATLWRSRLSEAGRAWSKRLTVATIVAFTLLNLAIFAHINLKPRDWDYKYFWLWGAAAAEGTNPYDRENLLRIAEPLGLSQELIDELACYYPPPSLLQFWPFGYLPFRAALLAWNVTMLAGMLLALWLLCDTFASGRRRDLAPALLAVALAFWPSSATVAFSQQNYWILVTLLLFWRSRGRPIGGFWLAVGVAFKPLTLLVLLHPLLHGRWKSLLAAAGGMALLTLAAVVVLGPEVFAQFLEREGISAQYRITQGVNQSLPGTLLRWQMGATAEGADLLFQSPWIVATMTLVGAATAWVVWRSRGAGEPFALGALLAMTLLVYPGTLSHYAVHLLPAMALLLVGLGCENESVERGPKTAAAALIAALAFAAFKATFFSTLIVWLAMCYEARRLERPSLKA
ncbi:hypothetical protein Mal64_13780 [Pseudobythopirellula maris]|uniref:Polyprenol-phosphate-mannose-dependent alpha-(1-2)-phosphatidylinositol mannoside mannosyltransferase n=1 Tax=Pseudobythopirellula maris TaxID=2527991 RepID=A0A5C5ZU68_9BACT|nr:glycosyltransferase family 87 protein [Pseudobythopirellula maris]TWT90979.1 hypothetical protein Mal64_13780 [Pseudobythopirellula maris]